MFRKLYSSIKEAYFWLSSTARIILVVKDMIPIIIALIEEFSLLTITLIILYIVLEIIFIVIFVKQSNRKIDDSIEEYESQRQVIQRWDTTLTGMPELFHPEKTVRLKDKLYEIPHPKMDHPSNKCRSCGENPTKYPTEK